MATGALARVWDDERAIAQFLLRQTQDQHGRGPGEGKYGSNSKYNLRFSLRADGAAIGPPREVLKQSSWQAVRASTNPTHVRHKTLQKRCAKLEDIGYKWC